MNSIQIEIADDGKSAVLTHNYEACTIGLCFTVPAGFRTDFASTPRWLWPWFPPVGLYAGAALVHDYLYANQVYTRRMCDAIFLDLMENAGVPKPKRLIMWAAVRLFGGKHFKK